MERSMPVMREYNAVESYSHLVSATMRLSCIPVCHVLAFAAALLISQPVIAGPASPHLLTELQPDNVTTVQLYLRGDEHHFYYQDVDWYAIVRDGDGWLVYWNGTDGTGPQDQVPLKVAQKKQFDHRRIKAGSGEFWHCSWSDSIAKTLNT